MPMPRTGAEGGTRFDISFPADANVETLDGRIILIITPDGGSEPRFQVSGNIGAPQVFGVDIDDIVIRKRGNVVVRPVENP